jgi:hypothetical protein
MRWPQAARWSLTAVFALGACSAAAQQDSPGSSWVVGVAAELDEDSSDSLLATLSLGVGPRTWLSFAAGRTSAERAEVAADTVSAGIDHRFGVVGVSFELERWGDSAALESADRRAALSVQQPKWRVALEHERRDIQIPFTLTGPLGGTLQRTAELNADSFGLSVRVQPADRWHVYASLAEHDYERDLALLPRVERLNLLSASTLTLANSFVDHERSVGFEREIGRGLLDAYVTRDESALDGSRFETVGAGWLFPVGRVDLQISVGRGRSQLVEPALYGGILILVYGR